MKQTTITLSEALIVNGLPLNQITLRSLKVKDLVKVNREGGDEFEKSLNLIAAAADLDRSVVDEIEMADLEALNAGLEAVLGKSDQPANGKTS